MEIMISPPYQAVAFDLDDTLLRDDRTISGYTLSVLHALDRKGVRLLPVSGRTRLSMKPYVDQIGNIPLYISCNGAEIWKTESGYEVIVYNELLYAHFSDDVQSACSGYVVESCFESHQP